MSLAGGAELALTETNLGYNPRGMFHRVYMTATATTDTFIVYGSPDGTNWWEIAKDDGTNVFVEEMVLGPPHRFYKIKNDSLSEMIVSVHSYGAFVE